jgi:hypothetical protein
VALLKSSQQMEQAIFPNSLQLTDVILSTLSFLMANFLFIFLFVSREEEKRKSVTFEFDLFDIWKHV